MLASAEGGDRVLRLLAARPRRAAVVDRNGAQLHLMDLKLDPIEGSRRVSFSYDQIPLVDGGYHVSLSAHGVNGPHYARVARIKNFKVVDPEWQDGLVRVPARVEVRPVETPTVAVR